MIIDGVNLSTLGLVVQRRGSSRAAARVQHAISGTPGAARRVRIGNEAPEARLLMLIGYLRGSSVADLQSKLDELKWRTRAGKDLVVEWSDQTGIEYVGRRESLDVREINPGAWIRKGMGVELAILCEDPRGRETTEQNKSTNGSPPLVLTPDVGTAIMPVKITVKGNNTSNLVDPTVDYRDKSDAVIASWTYSGTLTGTNTLVVDSERFTVELDGAHASGDLSGTIFDVDPGDGDYLGNPAGPDIRLTAVSGSAEQFKIEYRRRYQ